jgi:CubicO group peptidase (beta-lactamase class C family)
MPFDIFLRTRIFDPLGMDDTWFYLPEEKADRLVSVQQPAEDTWEKYPVTFYDTDYPVKGAKRFFSGGAGLSSTAKDYATFLQMYLNEGSYNGARLLSPTTIRSIMGDQMGISLGDGRTYYGLAFGVYTQKGQDLGGSGSEGTFDWGGYFNTQYFADPEEEVIGILMKQTQNKWDENTGWKFRQMTFASVEE